MSTFVEQAVAHFLGSNEIDWEKLKPVICFVVLWNRLEATCGNHISLSRLKRESLRVASSAAFDVTRYEPQISFFKCRYNANPYFLGSLFRQGNSEMEVQDSINRLLSTEVLTPQDLLQGVLMIPYRIRNNLFHGSKQPSELYVQTDLFQHVNEVLCLFHEDF